MNNGVAAIQSCILMMMMGRLSALLKHLQG
jgi:hypothetical protein